MIWIQSTLIAVLGVLRMKFGSCSHSFFVVSIETTDDWYRIVPLYAADMSHIYIYIELYEYNI